MKVAIIGAGAAGLCAGRHCLKENLCFDIFEQTGNVGGTWNYTDYTEYDENGLPVHSSMYKDLRTNLPKELMAYEDFPYPPKDKSYLPQEDVLDYIQTYAKKFEIEPHIQFYKHVLGIERKNDNWIVEFEDVKSKKKENLTYDAVIVCKGHYSDPFIPEIPGDKNFRGGIKHSHGYRSSERYKGKKVLVVGAGPSGVDISRQISEVADKTYLSYKIPGDDNFKEGIKHSQVSVLSGVDPSRQISEVTHETSLNHKFQTSFLISDAVQQKPVVSNLDDSRAYFVDGTSEEVDDIILCTGYLYKFPFLTECCKVRVEDNYVYPLYKQIISIENPTLAFIGLPFTVCPFPLFDVQIRFFMATLNGHFKLPPKEEMLKDLEEHIAIKKGKPQRKYHQLGEEQGAYFDELTETAKIKRVAPVVHSLYMKVGMGRNPNDCFRIIDEEHWEQIR